MGQGQKDGGNGGQSQLHLNSIAGGYENRIAGPLRSMIWPLYSIHCIQNTRNIIRA